MRFCNTVQPSYIFILGHIIVFRVPRDAGKRCDIVDMLMEMCGARGALCSLATLLKTAPCHPRVDVITFKKKFWRAALSALLSSSCALSVLSSLSTNQNAVFVRCRARNAGPPARAREDTPRRARRVTRAVTAHECAPAAARRDSRRRAAAAPAKRRVGEFM